MRDLDVLVPSALVEPRLASELLRDQPLPTLTRLFSRGGDLEFFDASSSSLTTWQAWIFGARAGQDASRLNVAELRAMACGLATTSKGARYVAEPAHFSIAKDHLRLDDPSGLDVTLIEARALADAALPILEEAGWRLDPIEPATLHHWMLFRDDASLSAAAIERAIGDNVAAWQPRTTAEAVDADAALAWRRCINEIQMLWFGHPVNDAREAAGRATVNTLWLSGNGAPPGAWPHYATVDSSLPLLAALSNEPDAERSLESFDEFIAAARAEDWSGWRDSLAALDARLARIVQAQAQGTIGRVTLALCGREVAKVLAFGSRDLGRFWRGWTGTPALAEVFADEGVP